MFVLFVDQCVPYEACWTCFVAACSTKETAFAIAKKYAVFNAKNEIGRYEGYKFDTAGGKKHLKNLRIILKEIEETSDMSELNEAYEKLDNDEGPFSIREVSVKSTADEFEVAEDMYD